jgi:hypothetical protein
MHFVPLWVTKHTVDKWKPDYLQIARLEYGIYGKTFHSAQTEEWGGECECSDCLLKRAPKDVDAKYVNANYEGPIIPREDVQWTNGYIARGPDDTYGITEDWYGR